MSRTVSVRFTDNQTGTGNDVPVQATGQSQHLNTLLAGTNVAKDGSITSIELQANFQNTTLVAFANGKELGKASGNGNNQMQFQRTPINSISITLTAS